MSVGLARKVCGECEGDTVYREQSMTYFYTRSGAILYCDRCKRRGLRIRDRLHQFLMSANEWYKVCSRTTHVVGRTAEDVLLQTPTQIVQHLVETTDLVSRSFRRPWKI